jgi:flavocytochrome c
MNTKEMKRIGLPKKWDDEADVVIIGSGFAGLAAALEAKNAGSSVIILEKMKSPGGNSKISGGVVSAAGSKLQAEQGIEDSTDSLLDDMLKAGLSLNHLELAQMVASESKEILQWTIDYLGVEYNKLIHFGGHSVPRSCYTYNKCGSAIVYPQIKKLKEAGVEVQTESYLNKLIVDSYGRVRGVQIREGYRFPDEKSGVVKHINAKKAVILATGGFSSDISFRTIQNPSLTDDVMSTNQPGATAEALLEALSIGATLVQPSCIQLGPWTSPDEKGFGTAPHFVAAVVFQYGIMIDPATGKRFVNELADREIRTRAIIKNAHPCIGIADLKGAKGMEDQTKKLISRGVVKQFNSIKELAEEYEIPFNNLDETIKNYNSYIQDGEDKEYGKYLQKDVNPIKEPFYAVRIWPKVHHTMGGLQINTKAQVIGLDKEPIEGLYAAGELTGGVHGAVRLGGCAVIDCLLFGRIAGKNAAAEE